MVAWPSWRLSPSSPKSAISRASAIRESDGLPWSDAFRAFERNRDTPRRHHQSGQRARTARPNQRGPDLWNPGPRQPQAARPARGTSTDCPRDRLESAGQTLFPLSSARSDRQAQGRRDDLDRAGNGGFLWAIASQTQIGSLARFCVGKQIGVHCWGQGAVENPRACYEPAHADARLLDRGSSKTKPRSCGNQPAHESLLNRRVSVLSPAVDAVQNYRAWDERERRRLIKALDGEHESRLLKKSTARVRNREHNGIQRSPERN